jgi:hypothetical protein
MGWSVSACVRLNNSKESGRASKSKEDKVCMPV